MLDIAVKVALAPLLVAQGLAVRRRALKLPEPAGPREGEAGAGPPLGLLLVGDSSAAGVGAETQDEALAGQLVARLARRYRLRWQLIAHTGDTTSDSLARVAAVAPGRYDIAVTALGVNDVTRALPARRFVARQAALHAQLTERFGVRQVIASGLPPMGAFPALPQPLRWVAGRSAQQLDRALARALAGTSDRSHLAFDIKLEPALMAADGFHPGPAGYALWASVLAAEIDRLASRAPALL